MTKKLTKPLIDIGLEGLKQYGDPEVRDGCVIVTVVGTIPMRYLCSLLCRFVSDGYAPNPALYRDFPDQGMSKFLELTRKRYACKFNNCPQRPYEAIPDLDEKRDMTIRFRKHLERESVFNTFIRAAEANGVDETLVRRIFMDHAKEKLANYVPRMPPVLGIDEKYVGGIARLVIGDVQKGTMLDMRRSRKDEAIRPYFEAMPDRDNVQVVCQDMWRGYRTLTRNVFRRAVTVIDKFHVVRMGDWAVSEVRKEIYKGKPKEEKLRIKFANHTLKTRLGQEDDKEAERMHELFGLYPKLLDAYLLKERFYNLYECQTRVEAEGELDLILRTMPDDLAKHFEKMTGAIKRWRPYIMNHFDHRYTNAYVERLNGLIDTINRSAFGLDIDQLRLKALLRYGEFFEKKVRRIRPRKIVPTTSWLWLGSGADEVDEDNWDEIVIQCDGVDLSLWRADLEAGTF